MKQEMENFPHLITEEKRAQEKQSIEYKDGEARLFLRRVEKVTRKYYGNNEITFPYVATFTSHWYLLFNRN